MSQKTIAEVTDLRAALDALRESEARFRAAFEENPETIGIFRPVLDADGRFADVEILYENRIARERYFGGATLEAIAGRRLFEAYPAARPVLFELFQAFVDHDQTPTDLLHGSRPDGEYWSETSLFRFPGGFVHVGRDVTAIIHAQQAAHALDLRGRAVLDSMLDGVVILDPVRDGDGRVIDLVCSYINEAAITGRGAADAPDGPEQLIGAQLLDLWPDARESGLFGAIVQVLETGHPLRLDGVTFGDPFQSDAGPRVLDLRVNRLGDTLVGSWRDVTDAHAATARLREGEARYAQLVNGIPVGVYRARTSADGHARWDHVTPQCGRILGIDPDRLLADPRSLFEAIHPADRGALLAGNARAHQAGRAMSSEVRVLRQDGWRVIRFVNEPADREGDEQLWLGFVEDVTEQRATAQALRETEERYRALAENANDVIWTMSPEGAVTSVSPSIERVRGLTPEAAMRQTVDEIHPPGSKAISLAYVGQVIADVAAGRPTPPFLGELEYWHADGGTVWCEVRVIPRYAPDGPLIELLGVSRDITERKRFNEELERRVAARTRELEVANEELRTFSYSVSHDLRAPVRAVAGFARILQRDLADQLDADSLHKLDNIITAGQTMGRLIDDLLSYTRVGQGAVHREPIPLAPSIDAVRIALSDRLAETAGILEATEPLAVPVGDRSLIDRILLNLVDNAIAYRRPGVPPHIRIGATRAGDRVTVAVADNGIGIPADAHERIFEVFTRLAPGGDETRSGIGLATVRKAARAMGAEITLESVVGEGTTFRFTLPAG